MDINTKAMEKASSGDTEFLKIESGENRFRIASKIKGVKEHSLELKDGWKFPICPTEQKKWELETNGEPVTDLPPCPICKMGVKNGVSHGVRPRYFAIAIDRKDGKVGILKSGSTVFKKIVSYNEDEDYGDVTEYDIKIVKTGEKLNTKYDVIAVPKKEPLTTAEMEEVSKVDIDRMTVPNDFDKLCEIAGITEEDVKKEEELEAKDIPFD